MNQAGRATGRMAWLCWVLLSGLAVGEERTVFRCDFDTAAVPEAARGGWLSALKVASRY
jgi:hypothetical protein